MKSVRMVSLDYEVNLWLSEKENVSGFINDVLSKIMSSEANPYLEMSPEQREFEKKKIMIQKEAYDKIKELENARPN